MKFKPASLMLCLSLSGIALTTYADETSNIDPTTTKSTNAATPAVPNGPGQAATPAMPGNETAKAHVIANRKRAADKRAAADARHDMDKQDRPEKVEKPEKAEKPSISHPVVARPEIMRPTVNR